jgi:hypothetical protein
MANLTSKSIKDSYNKLVIISDDAVPSGAGAGTQLTVGNADASIPMWLTTTKVGIGIGTPAKKLHTVDSSAEQFRIGYDGSKFFDFEVNSSSHLNIKNKDGDTKYTFREDGKLGIGVTSPQAHIHVKTPSGWGSFIQLDTTGATDNTGLEFKTGSVRKWMLFNDATGTDTDHTLVILDAGLDDGVKMAQGGTGFSDYSDERSKTSISPIENAVDKLNTLQAINFKWKYGSESRRTKNNIGLLAQEVHKVFPEAVTDCDNDLYKVIDHPILEGEKQAQGQWLLEKTMLVPVLVKAVQELSEKIKELESK